jgi:predicted nucleic acid-binding Zn ribbon protein
MWKMMWKGMAPITRGNLAEDQRDKAATRPAFHSLEAHLSKARAKLVQFQRELLRTVTARGQLKLRYFLQENSAGTPLLALSNIPRRWHRLLTGRPPPASASPAFVRPFTVPAQ